VLQQNQRVPDVVGIGFGETVHHRLDVTRKFFRPRSALIFHLILSGYVHPLHNVSKRLTNDQRSPRVAAVVKFARPDQFEK
jgi:hypothetical protein